MDLPHHGQPNASSIQSRILPRRPPKSFEAKTKARSFRSQRHRPLRPSMSAWPEYCGQKIKRSLPSLAPRQLSTRETDRAAQYGHPRLSRRSQPARPLAFIAQPTLPMSKPGTLTSQSQSIGKARVGALSEIRIPWPNHDDFVPNSSQGTGFIAFSQKCLRFFNQVVHNFESFE
jgi:hypothetical protein